MSISNTTSNIEEQIKNTETNLLKLNSEFENYGLENTGRIDDLSVQLTTRLEGTEVQIKALATNITNQIASLESKALKNVTYLSSDITEVSSIVYYIMYEILSSGVITIETNARNAFLVFVDRLKPSSRNEPIERSLLYLENTLQLTSSTFFGTKSIGLWDMGGKYSARKVKMVSHIIEHYLLSSGNINGKT